MDSCIHHTSKTYRDCELSQKKCGEQNNCYYRQLLKSQQDLKVAVEALEKIAYRDITIKSNFYSSTVANEALAKLSASTAQQKGGVDESIQSALF